MRNRGKYPVVLEPVINDSLLVNSWLELHWQRLRMQRDELSDLLLGDSEVCSISAREQ